MGASERGERNRERGWSVKRLWTVSELGAIGIVGGERSKDALWVVRRVEVNDCYLKSEYHSNSQDWLTTTRRERDLYAILLTPMHVHRSAHGSNLHLTTNNRYLVSKRLPDL